MVTGDRGERRAALGYGCGSGCGRALTVQLAPRPAQLAAQLAGQVHWRGGLTPAVDLAQPAPLVEAAAQLLGRRVFVGVQDRRAGHDTPWRSRRAACRSPARDPRHRAPRETAPAPRPRVQTQALASVKNPRAPISAAAGSRAPRSGRRSFSLRRSTRGAPSGASEPNQRSSSDAHRRRCVGARVGTARRRAPRRRASSKPPSRRSSQRSSAGSASWVSNATCAARGLAHQQVARAAVAEVARGRSRSRARRGSGPALVSHRSSRSRRRAARVRSSGGLGPEACARGGRRRCASGWRR